MNGTRGMARLVALFLVLGLLWPSVRALADTNSQVINWLATHDTYVTNGPISGESIPSGTINELNAAVSRASSQGIAEKLAILSHYPYPERANPHEAANALLYSLGVDGIVAIVSANFTIKGQRAPGGVGIASDQMSAGDEATIERKAAARCRIAGYVSCLLYASQLSLATVKHNKSTAFHDAAVFWVAALVVFGLIILLVVLIMGRRRKQATQSVEDLRRAAYATLGMADQAVQEIESRGTTLSPEAREGYDRALGLRDRARQEIERSQSVAALRQANEDAAQAVLAMQGTMRSAGIRTPLTDPLNPGEHRCFYCGRTDRPPYTARTIEDGKGNSLQIEICAVDMEMLQQGKTPQIATVQYGGSPVPWWSVPSSPWYHAYGGPSWQYWLPFLVGMDVGHWFGGGWGGFYGNGPVVIENNVYGDPGMIDPGQGVSVDPGYVDVGSAGDFGGDTSGWDGGDVGSSGDWSGDNSGGW